MPAGYTIRKATPDDAEAMLAFLLELVSEPGIHLISEPDELANALDIQRRVMTEMTTTENSTMLLAISNGEIVGEVSCRGEARRAKRHVSVVGISVAEDWRDRGLGTTLMGEIIDWARASKVVTRLELLVFAGNHRAVHVYEKLGFQIEGRKRRAIYKNGEYCDEYIMALLLDTEDTQ